MTPLQRIAMGLVIVALAPQLPHDPSPSWNHYDALPDPLGWLLVLSGVWALGRTLDVDWARWAGVLALVVSVPMWFPQLNHHLAPQYNPDLPASITWALSLPTFLFCLALCRAVGRAGADERGPGGSGRDTYVAGRFGTLTWAFAACVVLPLVGYNLPMKDGMNPVLFWTLLLIGLAQLVLVYVLFRVHRRTYLGGPGPREVAPPPRGRGGRTNAAPDGPERRS